MSIHINAGSESFEKGGPSGDKLYPFHPGVHYIIPGGGRHVEGFWLPGHDLQLSKEDQSFKSSYVPYRDLESGFKDSRTNTPAFTNFFTVVQMHAFAGSNKLSFISPRTLKRAAGVSNAEETLDPMADCYWAAWTKFNKNKLREYQHLITPLDDDGMEVKFNPHDKKPTPPTAFNRPNDKALFNAWATDPRDEGKWKVALIVCSHAAIVRTCDVLSNPTSIEYAEQRAGAFKNYLLGDVTDPKKAMRFVFRMLKDSAGKQMCVPCFTSSPTDNQLTDVQYREVPESILEQRYDFTDGSKVLYIPSYQEIVDAMLKDPLVVEDPLAMEIVKEVCSDHASLNTNTQALGTPQDRAASSQSGAAFAKFWVSVSGSAGTEASAADVKAMVEKDDGLSAVLITPLGQPVAWKTPAEYGFVKAPPVAPPAPPAPPAAPTAPPTPPAVEPGREFWAVKDGNTVEVKEADLVAWVTEGFTGNVMLKGEATWKDTPAYGIKPPAPPAAPPAPPAAPPAPPAAPPAPPAAPPAPPAAPPAPPAAPPAPPAAPPAPPAAPPASEAVDVTALTAELESLMDKIRQGEATVQDVERAEKVDGMLRQAK